MTQESEHRLGIVLLAAGAGSRMGQIKPLAKWQNLTFVARLLEQVQPLPFPVALILGAHRQPIEATLEQCLTYNSHIQILNNQQWQHGMSTSIRLGVEHFKDCDAVMFIAVDQVLIQTQHIESMISKWRQHPTSIHCARYAKTYGIPAIFPAQFFPELLSLSGEKGAKPIIAKSASTVFINMPEAAIDIDTQQQLEQLTKNIDSVALDLSSNILTNKEPTT
jgi:molybdenum cofactor cytidylyltransferase